MGNRKLFAVTRLQFHVATISNLSKAFKWQKNLHKLLTARSPSCRVNVNCKRFAVSHEKPDAKGLYMHVFSIAFTANGKHEFVPRNQVSPSIVVQRSL